jgi:signal transduction histidine kinase
MAATVALRRRFPAGAGIAAALLANAVAIGWKPPNAVSYGVAWICSIYGLTAWTRTREFALGVAAVAAPTFVAYAVSHQPHGGVGFSVIALVVMLFVRHVVGDRERRARLAERERDVAAREAVVEERARIARELHDAIAHNVSMMVVQAGAERRVLDGRSESTHEVLETIERIGRGALTEMRRLVGMLRTGTVDPLAPQPGLDDVPTLVAQVREAGLPVELYVEGERRELPVGIELSAFRIVQEALTNALKHAGAATALVRLTFADGSLAVEVTDTGRGPAPTSDRIGHGLVGIRERVALYGGILRTGPRSGGGFRVYARIPLEPVGVVPA